MKSVDLIWHVEDFRKRTGAKKTINVFVNHDDYINNLHEEIDKTIMKKFSFIIVNNVNYTEQGYIYVNSDFAEQIIKVLDESERAIKYILE